jgi:hypothetical protein
LQNCTKITGDLAEMLSDGHVDLASAEK